MSVSKGREYDDAKTNRDIRYAGELEHVLRTSGAKWAVAGEGLEQQVTEVTYYKFINSCLHY